MRTRTLAVLAAGVAFLTLGACGGSDDSAVDNVAPPVTVGTIERTAPPDTILMSGIRFFPMKLTVTAGQKIALVNEDSITHDVRTRDAKAISSGDIKAGKSASVTMPTAPGDYEVICRYHSMSMRMTVTVR